METFPVDLVQVNENLKEAYNELLICHKGKKHMKITRIKRLKLNCCYLERDGLLKLADKLDLIENDLNFIRSFLKQEKSALNDLKQNLAPISEFLNISTNEKTKKRSVNFALTKAEAGTRANNTSGTKVITTLGNKANNATGSKEVITAGNKEVITIGTKEVISIGTKEGVTMITTSKSLTNQIHSLSEEEFELLPKYLKGRLTSSKINAFIQDFNRFLLEKYTLLLRSNPAKLSVEQRQKFFEWKATELEELDGKNFLTETDFKTKNGVGPFKFDQVARNILTILRQVGRIKEVRSPGIIRYVIN